MSFFNRLSQIFMPRGERARLARETGIKHQVMSKWAKGSYPEADKLIDFCGKGNISANWLLLGVGPEKLQDCAGGLKNGKVVGRIEKQQDKVSEAVRMIEEWVRSVDKPDQRAWAIIDGLEREYKEFAEWQKKREQFGECGTPANNESAANGK